MATAILMPRLGMTMEEGTVIQWPLATGGKVAKGEIVLIIESEKSEVEIEAPASGFFRHAYIDEGETVPCGELLGAITETPEEAFDCDGFRAEQQSQQDPGDSALEVKPRESAPASAEAPAASRKPVVPAARAAAKALGIDPQSVEGTGPRGRVTKEDVEAHAAAREALVQVAEGVRLEVRVAGQGEPVVLLPGLGVDISAFSQQSARFVDEYCVHAVNPRGVGLSDAPEAEAYELAQTAADAAASYTGAGHVVGASLGAAAALELAIAYPERVKTLTLITPFVEATARLLAVGEGWQRLAGETTSETLASALLPWFFSDGFLADPAARGRTLRGLTQSVARVPAATLARSLAGLARWSGSRKGDLAGISVPTLVIAAEEDLLTPSSAAMAEAIAGASLLTVPGAGHAVALEASEAVNAALASHFSRGEEAR
ncbi:MAG: alpha/beta fold hydrolase [Myxococcota bacterium]|nr:alpha/beta fold hydrolase [Myxococcota bacterium]